MTCSLCLSVQNAIVIVVYTSTDDTADSERKPSVVDHTFLLVRKRTLNASSLIRRNTHSRCATRVRSACAVKTSGAIGCKRSLLRAPRPRWRRSDARCVNNAKNANDSKRPRRTRPRRPPRQRRQRQRRVSMWTRRSAARERLGRASLSDACSQPISSSTTTRFAIRTTTTTTATTTTTTTAATTTRATTMSLRASQLRRVLRSTVRALGNSRCQCVMLRAIQLRCDAHVYRTFDTLVFFLLLKPRARRRRLRRRFNSI